MKKQKGTVLIACGLVLLAAALGLTVYNMQTELEAGRQSAKALGALKKHTASELVQTAPLSGETGSSDPVETFPELSSLPEYAQFPDMEMPTVEVDGHAYVGTLRIPELGLELPVMSEWSYPKLKKAPCRFSGSAYQNNLILIAHNYASHFGNLKRLMPGAEVTFTDMAGNVFCYAVAETEILKPRQMEELVGTDYPLTLLTCTIGGETRVTVRCEKTREIPVKSHDAQLEKE